MLRATDEVERWIEVRDSNGRLITALELLSPSNKLEGSERDRFHRKRSTFVSGGINFVEIDLVRPGGWIFPEGVCNILRRAGACCGETPGGRASTRALLFCLLLRQPRGLNRFLGG